MPECKECSKSFETEEALKQHAIAKHSQETGKKLSTKSKSSLKLGIVGIIIIVLAIAVFVTFSKPGYSSLPYTEHVKGNGTVEIVEFSDFQCPACGAAYPEVKSFLASNADKVKFVYKHFPLTQIHPYATKAAEASECAADQEKFWEYHNKLFENQRNLLKSDLVRYANELELDMEKFNACLDSGVMKDRINKDVSEASSKGVRATPTFFSNGKKFEGVLTAEQLEREIA